MKKISLILLGMLVAVAGTLYATGYPERVGETVAQRDRVRGLIDATAIDVVDATTLKIGGTAVTSTAAELNIVDGVTATAAEINKLDDSLITLTTVDQTALFTVGRIHTDVNGAQYIYLEGIGSVAIGSVVSFIVTTTGAATTALAITNAVGHVGVAMAAVIAGDFGWFQITGLNLVAQCDSSAAIGVAYIGGTTGGVDSTAVAGDRIDGMQITVAEASNDCGVFLTYPTVSNATN